MRTPAHEKTYNALHAATKRAEEAERQRDEAREDVRAAHENMDTVVNALGRELEEVRTSCAAMRTILGKLCAAMEGLRPFPLVLNAVADGLIADGRAALAALDSKEQQQDEC